MALQQANALEKRQMEEHLSTMIRHHTSKVEATEQAHQSLQQKLEDYHRRCQVLGQQQQQGEKKTQEQQDQIASLTQELDRMRGQLSKVEQQQPLPEVSSSLSEASSLPEASSSSSSSSRHVRKLCKAVQLLDSRLNVANEEVERYKESLAKAERVYLDKERRWEDAIVQLRRENEKEREEWGRARTCSVEQECQQQMVQKKEKRNETCVGVLSRGTQAHAR